MWIKRDISDFIQSAQGFYIQIIIGPRQSGKSSLCVILGKDEFKEINFDDLQTRTLAQTDPSLFLSLNPPPLVLDEVQYVPNLFSQLKLLVDLEKKKKILTPSSKKIDPSPHQVRYRLTCSNLILLSKNVSETLVGKAQYFYLNTLSVSEIVQSFPTVTLPEILFKGGLPELWTNPALKVTSYLNDYIMSYIQKDVAQSAGIEKLSEFDKVLRLLSGRVGQLINFSEVARDSGVKSVTVKEWTSVLNKSQLVYLLLPFETNLSNRLIKSPKLYFWDSGLAVRLQGWSEISPMCISPMIGGLFENLVLGEIIKFKNNYGQDWPLYFWRTREGEEIDFILQTAPNEWLAFDAKWSQNPSPEILPTTFKKLFPHVDKIILITPEGEEKMLSKQCLQLPIKKLSDFLKKFSL